MHDRNVPPASPETATDLADLERLVEAKRPPKIVVEELSSAHLELEEDEEDEEIALEHEALVDVAPEPAHAIAAIPEAPKTSPVPVALAATMPASAAPAAIIAEKEESDEDRAGFTQPFRREDVIAAAAMPLAEDHAQMTQPFRRPSSIAPVAVDVARRPDTTLPIPRMTAQQAESIVDRIPPPRTNLVPWVIAASIIGLFLAGGAVVASVASSSSDVSTTRTTAATLDAPGTSPRTAAVTAAKTVVTDEADTAPSISVHGEKAEPAPVFSSTQPVSVDALPTVSPPPAAGAPAPRTAHAAPAPTTKTLVPAPTTAPAPPQPAPRPAAAAPAPAPRATTGIVHVPPPLVVVVVDGQHRRVVNGDVVLACGTHKIRAGMSEQVVNVPCGGAISL